MAKYLAPCVSGYVAAVVVATGNVVGLGVVNMQGERKKKEKKKKKETLKKRAEKMDL